MHISHSAIESRLVELRAAHAGGVPKLRRELSELALRLSESSSAEFASAAETEPAAGWLVVTFAHNEPDLRITAPAVPG